MARRSTRPRVLLNQATVALLEEIFDAQPTAEARALAQACARWLTAKRFAAFVQEHRLKIRKKVRVLRHAAEAHDLACELYTAYLLLQEVKFDVAYEPRQHARGRSADFGVTFRTHTHFFVEVTRIRSALPEPEAESEHALGLRLAHAVCEKLGQCATETPNVLWVWGDRAFLEAVAPDEAMAALKRRAEQSEDAWWTRYGFAKRADFMRQLQRLNAIVLQDDTILAKDDVVEAGARAPAKWWANSDTRHTLPAPIAHHLRTLVGAS